MAAASVRSTDAREHANPGSANTLPRAAEDTPTAGAESVESGPEQAPGPQGHTGTF
jgi:hypothetical protein